MPSVRFVLLQPLPLIVRWAGRSYRFEVEREPVSGEWRLFARDLLAPIFTAYLLATSGKQGELEGRMFSSGVAIEGRPGNAIFRQLVTDGRAREVAAA